MIGTIDMIRQTENQNTAVLENFPIEGMGKRAMGCDRYDKCLYKAAMADWHSFNCDGCEYEGQGALEFIDPYFIPMFEEPVAEGDQEMELIDLVFNLPSLNYTGEALNFNDHAA